MCGICGFIDPNLGESASKSQLLKMLEPILHRGPDGMGIWTDSEYGIGLGHRRLSIVDITPTGHQPMISACGRFILVFNGEIYNHKELRLKISKCSCDMQKRSINSVSSSPTWHGDSDTETLLNCLSIWGVQKTLDSVVGMFAFALWDRQEKSLTLARDRVGEKPLYYGFQDGTFLFGSELQSLKSTDRFIGNINWSASASFFKRNYISAPLSIYEGIFKLIPGTYIEIKPSDFVEKLLPEPKVYWSLAQSSLRGQDKPFKGTINDAVDELELLLRQVVQQQSMADVPVGAFLSGGIDSSTVVAMMQSETTSNVTTFAIGMPEERLDESKYASAMSEHFGTNHIEHVIQPGEALDLIPKLPEIWDEPFADSSQIPTYLVSQLAKKHVTVALSGDGGDEIFLGYPQYAFFIKLWRLRYLGKLPWDSAFSILAPHLRGHNAKMALQRAKSVVGAWKQPNSQMLNRYWYDGFRHGGSPLFDQEEKNVLNYPLLNDAASTAALWDSGTYLPDDILVKVDRASMANSLETRAPLLDHRIIEFAHSLPLNYKLRGGASKKVLREVLYRHAPPKLVDRKKMGFSIPLDNWLRNDLKDWGWELIKSIPNTDSPIRKSAVIALWEAHQRGNPKTSQLWACLMFIAFMQRH
jgi:asparagine synthase (glutamine-hydrolysing)